MGRLQESEDGALEAVLAQVDGTLEANIDSVFSRLDTLLVQWRREQGQQVPESFSDAVYAWMRIRSIVHQSRDLIAREQKDGQGYDTKVVKHLRALQASISREERGIKNGDAPEYVQLLRRLGAQLLFDIEGFV